MFDALKTDNKFNLYMIILPAAGALCVYQLGKIAVGGIQIGLEKINQKKTNQ